MRGHSEVSVGERLLGIRALSKADYLYFECLRVGVAGFTAEALGGPTMYSDSYGDETTVVKMHSGNGEHDEMDRRAIACFDQALADVGLANDGALRQVLHDYFAWATTKTMSRYHQSADDVPNGLSIPHWSWDGLQK